MRIIFFTISFFVIAFSNPLSKQCPNLKQVEAFLIDLDGTMNTYKGLIDGAVEFYEWILKTGKPYVFLSNSASKGSLGVQKKLMTPPFNITNKLISLVHIQTASESLAYYLRDNVPSGSRLYILQGTTIIDGMKDSCINTIIRTIPKEMETFNWRTDMTEDEIKEWAKLTKIEPKKSFVINCASKMSDYADPVTGKPGYSDWSYEIFSKASWLLLNGATLISSAPDLLSNQRMVGNALIASPGAGGLHALLSAVSYPKSLGNIYITGKGGNRGTESSMKPAVDRLRAQGYNGTWANIAMVGDTLYSDIKAGKEAGMKTIFVLSGVNSVEDMKYYPDDVPTCILPSVGYIPKEVN